MRLLPTPKFRAQVVSRKTQTTARSFVSRAATKKERRSKETKTDVPELDFISNLCTGPGGGARGNEKGTPDDQKANQLAARVRTFSHTFYLFFLQEGGLSRLDER